VSGPASITEPGSPEPALWDLFCAIAAQNSAAAVELLAARPELARSSLQVGATRRAARQYFFDSIDHYAYAGDTALHLAAAAYEVEAARALLAHGAQAWARNRRGAEPLHYACDAIPGSKAWRPAAQRAMVELLLGAGAPPQSLDKSGVAPLHRAVRARAVAAVQALLEHGADVGLANGSGSTPLHLALQDTGRGGSGTPAARDAQAEVLRLLLAHGASPETKNAAGKSAFDCARSD
jgi:ankyrin repeat protein